MSGKKGRHAKQRVARANIREQYAQRTRCPCCDRTITPLHAESYERFRTMFNSLLDSRDWYVILLCSLLEKAGGTIQTTVTGDARDRYKDAKVETHVSGESVTITSPELSRRIIIPGGIIT